jgi:hypothetical protein
MAPEPQRRREELPGMPGTSPDAVRGDGRPPKSMRAAALTLLVLLAIHPLTLVIVGAVVIWIVLRWW